MSHTYSQWIAFKALCRAALRSIAKSPSSVIFTIAFPLVFIFVFGFLGDTDFSKIPIAFTTGTPTDHPLVLSLKEADGFKIITAKNNAELNKLLEKGDIAAILDVHHTKPERTFVQMTVGSSQQEQAVVIKDYIDRAVLKAHPEIRSLLDKKITLNETIVTNRSGKTIDFILPGQLGFSLLAASVFGTAFVFFNLRQTLVLKRFFATPVHKTYILLAEGVARMIFQMAGALLIIFIGYYFLNFTITGGVITLLNMLALCMLALLVFMSFGFIISGLAASESVIPPLSNIITLPQFLLAGTFFSISNFPKWLQPVSYALPLTYFNDAMRQMAMDGASLWDVRTDIAVLLLWGMAGYAVAARVFRWE